MRFKTNDTERMRIDSNGRVSIGGTTVTDVNMLNIQGSGASSNIGIVFNDTNTSKIYSIQNGGSALKFFDYTASTERFRIGSSGELGIGGATYGTSGQVLTSGGSGAAPSWTTISAGSMTQITTGTIGTNSSYSFSLGSSWWNTYKYVMFIYDATYQSGDPPSGTANAFFRLGTLTSSSYVIAGQGGTTNNGATQTYGWFNRTSPGDNNPIFFIGRIYTDGTNTSVYTESSAAGQNGNGFQSVYAPTTPETFKVEQPYFGSERYRYEGTITFYGVN